MSVVVPLPLLGTQAGFRRFSVPEYHKLIEIGVLTENDRLELLEGYLVNKMSRNPPHDAAIQLLQDALLGLLPAGWRLRIQSAITLADSEPEPDLAVVRGNARTYTQRHPGPADAGIVIEVSESTLDGDRIDKGRIYARAGIAVYWIVNLVERQVEVYTQPSGPGASPSYGQTSIHKESDAVPLVLDNVTAGMLNVRDLLP